MSVGFNKGALTITDAPTSRTNLGLGTAATISTPIAVTNGGTGLSTTTINQVLYSSAANTIAGLATANSAVLATDGSGVPSITATPTVTSITFGAGAALNNYQTGTWTPTLVGQSTAGTTTYSVQQGYYTYIGNMCYAWGRITITAATGTGLAQFQGLPFTIKNQTNYVPEGTLKINGTSWTYPTGTTFTLVDGVLNTTNCNPSAAGSGATTAGITMQNAAATFNFSLCYQV